MDFAGAHQDKSPPKKRKHSSEAFTLDLLNSFDTTSAEASKEFSMLLTEFNQALRERAKADISKIKVLKILLAEAQNLESYLKERISRLKQTLTQISDKLSS
ncbi:hypothetical protein FQA47_010968 [Oryzias melastigma]|uniref:Uncharacterized protein n=1 Tax=Oryzias melastigma TaxID=30732 RepID=A0A834C2P5_ORYME|nr:hypothetical protein FQA47_010968 [Oryzias melastigma]